MGRGVPARSTSNPTGFAGVRKRAHKTCTSEPLPCPPPPPCTSVGGVAAYQATCYKHGKLVVVGSSFRSALQAAQARARARAAFDEAGCGGGSWQRFRPLDSAALERAKRPASCNRNPLGCTGVRKRALATCTSKPMSHHCPPPTLFFYVAGHAAFYHRGGKQVSVGSFSSVAGAVAASLAAMEAAGVVSHATSKAPTIAACGSPPKPPPLAQQQQHRKQ